MKIKINYKVPTHPATGAPAFDRELSQVVRESSELAERAGGTALGVGAVVGLALLSHMAGRDWKADIT